MLDAGLNYRQVYDSLTDQGHGEEEIMEVIQNAADEEVEFQ